MQQIEKCACEFSVKGLRTLVFAGSTVSNSDDWIQQWQKISQLSEDNEKYRKHTEMVETGM